MNGESLNSSFAGKKLPLTSIIRFCFSFSFYVSFHRIDDVLLLQWRLYVFRLLFSGAIEFSNSKNVYDHWKSVTTVTRRSGLPSVLWKNYFYFYTFNFQQFFAVFLFSIIQPQRKVIIKINWWNGCYHLIVPKKLTMQIINKKQKFLLTIFIEIDFFFNFDNYIGFFYQFYLILSTNNNPKRLSLLHIFERYTLYFNIHRFFFYPYASFVEDYSNI